ncbi:MAG TPA: thioredoxin domain-containing protein, partial [Allocoleopsis sp.]
NKPIFLSIGYSSCHWCTVMEGEAFSDPDIAEYMNTNFIAIKVDREERPDIDSIYMQALQIMTGQGGWPLNVFLSPDDLLPFYGGTYFPVEPRYNRPGFLKVLQYIHQFYHTEQTKLQSIKTEIFNYIQESAILGQDNQISLDQDLLQIGLESNTGIVHSGGYGPAFPMIPYSDLTLRAVRFNFPSQYDVKKVAKNRGLNLALGGIYDHVAGGFHRYTVDPHWTVPHFEKMLYDNGQILQFLSDLWSDDIQEPAFKRAVLGTIEWLKREMTSSEGYFYAAQDADSFVNSDEIEPEEGAFYIWNYAELQELLSSQELQELKSAFTVTSEGNFEGHIVLKRVNADLLSESLEEILNKLFFVRYGEGKSQLNIFPPAKNNQDAKNITWPGRIPAVTDTKMIVAWNSLTISGLVRAYSVFGEKEALDLAINAANFILNNQRINGRLYRLNYEGKVSIVAQSEDYAFLIKALLDLEQVSDNAEKFWLGKAIELQREFDELLWSEELGGYYNNSVEDAPELLVRERNYIDSAIPSANGVAIANLVRLFLGTEKMNYLDKAEQGLRSFSKIMVERSSSCPSLFTALDWYNNCTLIRTNNEQKEKLLPKYLPTSVLNIMSELPESTIGLVCKGLTCLKPATNWEQFWEQIQKTQVRK